MNYYMNTSFGVADGAVVDGATGGACVVVEGLVAELLFDDELDVLGFDDELDVLGFDDELDVLGFDDESDVLGFDDESDVSVFCNESEPSLVPEIFDWVPTLIVLEGALSESTVKVTLLPGSVFAFSVVDETPSVDVFTLSWLSLSTFELSTPPFVFEEERSSALPTIPNVAIPKSRAVPAINFCFFTRFTCVFTNVFYPPCLQ